MVNVMEDLQGFLVFVGAQGNDEGAKVVLPGTCSLSLPFPVSRGLLCSGAPKHGERLLVDGRQRVQGNRKGLTSEEHRE